MLLINILHKYPTKSSINNIIKEYIKEVPNEINEVSQYGDDALKICASYNNNFETMKILLEGRATKQININRRNCYGVTLIHYTLQMHNLVTFKLLA